MKNKYLNHFSVLKKIIEILMKIWSNHIFNVFSYFFFENYTKKEQIDKKNSIP